MKVPLLLVPLRLEFTIETVSLYLNLVRSFFLFTDRFQSLGFPFNMNQVE